MNYNEDTLAGFPDFGGTINVSFKHKRLAAAVVVSALMHVVAFLIISAHAGFNSIDDISPIPPPTITASLVFEPRLSDTSPPGKAGKTGNGFAAKKNSVPAQIPFPETRKTVEPPPSRSPEREKKGTKPPGVLFSSVDKTILTKPSETPVIESGPRHVQIDDVSAAGEMDLILGNGGSAFQHGNASQDGSGRQAYYGKSSGAGSGTGANGGSGPAEYEGGGGGFFTKDSAAIPRYKDNATPVYPSLARRRGYEGLVVLVVEVLADGRPGEVRIGHSSGHEILDNAAQKAAAGWRFEPGTRNGKPVKMLAEVPVRFVLNE